MASALLEIRVRAETLTDAMPLRPGFSIELIRIRPDRVLGFGLTNEGAAPPQQAG